MNKKNFGRVIERIEANPTEWNQSRIPRIGERPSCGTPFCFLGHAQYLRTGEAMMGPADCNLADTYNDPSLLEWLGVTENEAIRLYQCTNKLSDFKRWHKAGKVG